MMTIKPIVRENQKLSEFKPIRNLDLTGNGGDG